MRHLARGNHFVTQGPLGAERQFVFRGLAVDDILRSAWSLGCLVCARAGPLLADYEQQPEVALSRFEQRLHSLDHGGDDALGIARAPPPDMIVILARDE